MGVYDTDSLKKGINSVDGSDSDANDAERLLYNKGYLLEIEHVPTGYKVKFPAYLENFSDAYTQSWNAEDVYGRMDPIAVYQNTRRAIAMSWHVPANSPFQAKDNDATVGVYPKTVTLNFELNVLHEHAMGWMTGKEGDSVLRESTGGFPYKTNLAVPALPATSDDAPKTSAKAKETDPGANAGENALKGSE